MRRRKNAVSVDASLLIESVPDDRGYVEHESLREQNERDSLVVGYHVTLLVLSGTGQLAVPRQVVRVLHPAEVRRKVDVSLRDK